MSRKHKHEEHANHEAWAIPYGDLVTLLLAFFVVMYAISTVNEGKYRAVSDSLSAAFKGTPRAISPIQVGDKAPASIQGGAPPIAPEGNLIGEHSTLIASGNATKPETDADGMTQMDKVIGELESSMAELIQRDMLAIHRKKYGVEIELRTDILFPSGSATMPSQAIAVLQRLADTLKPLPYPMRVEGHTDNRPIATALFPSNWELSAARAATVVHLFMERGIDPTRLSVIGLGEFRPIADNASDAGRNMNRRVLIVILSAGAHVDGVDDAEPDTAGTSPPETTAATAAQPVAVTQSAVTQSTVTPSTVTRSAAVAPAVGPSPL
jgi:chemotaxis protein MotB